MPPAGAPAAPPAAPVRRPAPSPCRPTAIQVRINPVEEWRQMYREAWRIEREFFYDPNAHGYDLGRRARSGTPLTSRTSSRAAT